jgi:hypothetical protein
MDFKPNDRQQQFGFTLGGPLRRDRVFFFAGFDQHIFHVPTVVQFSDGSSKVVPQKGAEPLYHGDYEDSDKALVFAAADQLSTLAGEFPSQLLGNTGFFKLDVALTPHHSISARVSTSRYYGQNNVFFDPASPVTTFAISDNGEEDVSTETASLTLTSSLPRDSSVICEPNFRATCKPPPVIPPTCAPRLWASSTALAAPPSCRVAPANTVGM